MSKESRKKKIKQNNKQKRIKNGKVFIDCGDQNWRVSKHQIDGNPIWFQPIGKGAYALHGVKSQLIDDMKQDEKI